MKLRIILIKILQRALTVNLSLSGVRITIKAQFNRKYLRVSRLNTELLIKKAKGVQGQKML